MLPTPFAAPRHARPEGQALRGLRVLGLGVLVAVVLSLVLAQDFALTLVYSLCITLACWVFIDGGRVLAARWLHRRRPAGSPERASLWPGWGWMSLVLLLGTAAGLSLGTALANLLTGARVPGLLGGELRRGLALMLVSLLPGLGLTAFFYARERLAASRAAEQAAQRRAAEHQLRLLESQLEPHMLFNTLANLRVLIELDPPRALAMLDRLIAFLRATLGASRAGRQTLEAEFARVADYLALMQVRMGARLQPRLDLPAALAGAAVPALLLQPLVENAIKHGLEPAVAGGQLRVSAAQEGGQLVLRVRDTGTGLAERDEGPRPAMAEGTRFGLSQVRARLAALYGPAAGLALERAADAEGGTLATVRIPLEAA